MPSRILARLFQKLAVASNQAARWAAGTPTDETTLLIDDYVSGMPTPQKAVDILPGWIQALPEHVGAKAGSGVFYHDFRILWAIEQFGSLKNRKVLELGPLEASHTYMLDQQDPEFIHAVEAKATAYLRCLIVKEVLGLRHARFFIGDFVAWLEANETHYDLIVGSGVLYHMADPLKLLTLLARRSDNFFLWTHYFDEAAMPPQDPRRAPFVGDSEKVSFHGETITLHERSYLSAWQKTKAFCGGMYDRHYWLEQDDIIKAIRALGFDDVRTTHDDKNHQNGPSFSLFARRGPSHRG